jgi:hypothetical protein
MLEFPIARSDTGLPQASPPRTAEYHVTFHEVLSALNPLQYLPVIGTIYRSVTGDQIPEPVRRIGSLVVSALMGGPVGVAINLATIAAEKLTGVDLDRTGQNLLAGNHAADGPPTPFADPAQAPSQVARPEAPMPPAPSHAKAWSPAQLAAYGVRTAENGTLTLADLNGAEVLNALEVARLQMAQSAYGRVLGLTG